MITSICFGDGVKNWSTITAGNKLWYDPDVVHYDQDVEGAKKLLAGLGWKDRDGDGFLEDTHGHTISFTLNTNSDNKIRVAMGNFVKDDLAARVGEAGFEVKSSRLAFLTKLVTAEKRAPAPA